MAPCPECGAEVKRRFCTECGRPNDNFTAAKRAENIKVIYDRTLWPYCLCSIILCCPVHLKISNRRIDAASGYCYGNLDTIDMRRVKDIGFDRSCFQMCLNRGTITIYSADETHGTFKFSCFHARAVFDDLRALWAQTKQKTIVD